MGSSVRNTINLGNSIIGVSILAMPYCFERCGIVLGSLLLLASGLVTRITCHLLLKAAITARRRNYEFLAFHTYGPTGKLVVEIGVLGFLLGSCVAFFVVMGDLAPPLASDLFLLGGGGGAGGGVLSPQRLRLVTLFLLGTCVGLPLGLLRNLDSLTSLSALSLAFYCLLVLKVFVDSFPVLWSGAWWDRVVLWRHENLLSVLPIFAMALSCQPQLFEIFDTVNEPSLKRMNSVVNGAVQMCSMVYITMGFFGYVAFCGGDAGAPPIPGNVLVRLGSSVWSEFLKLGFVATLVVSFPLCLFPCRTSLHSLLFKRGGKFHDPGYDYIPDGQFRLLTVVLVGATLATACLVPNIEMVLGLTGSTIGTLICVIVPGMVFARIITKDTNERLLAKFLSWAGLCLMIGCTVTTLSQVRAPPPATIRAPPGGTRYGQPAAVVVSKPPALLARADLKVANVSPLPDLAAPPKVSPAAALPPKAAVAPAAPVEKRLEPVEPVEPVPHEQVVVALKPSPAKPEPPALPPARVLPPVKEPLLDPEALKKEDREIEAATSSSGKKKAAKEDAPQPLLAKGAAPPTVAPQAVEAKQEALLVKIAQEQEVQKKMLEDLQRELKQELAKHKQEAVAAPRLANGTLPAAQPPAAQGAPAAVVQKIVPAVPPAQPSGNKAAEAPREGLPATLSPVLKQEPPKRLDGTVLRNLPVVGPAGGLPVQQNLPAPQHPVQSADTGLGGSAPHGAQARVQQQPVQQQPVQQQPVQQQQVQQQQVQQQQVQQQHVQQQQVQQQQAQQQQVQQQHVQQQHVQQQQVQQQQVIKLVQGVGSDALVQGPKVALMANHPLPAKPVQGSVLKQPQQQQDNLSPQLQLPKAQAAEVFDKPVRNIMKPLDVILQRRDGNNVPVPAVGKLESVQKPQLPEGQAAQPRSADSHRVAEGHHYAEKPAQPVPEAKREAVPRLVVQRADDRPLVAKMSKDVKREAPAVVPRSAVPKDVPAAQEPVVERKNGPPAGDIPHAAASDSAGVKLEPKDAFSPSLPSPARPDVVPKNEIRRK